MNWDEYFRNIAHTVKLKSKDKFTQIGAVIVGSDKEITSTGYNSFPRGINDNLDERQERPEKYYWMAHAEINAIVNSARIGVSTKGSTLYLTCGLPCCGCSRAIINAGIKRVVCDGKGDSAKGKQYIDEYKRSEIMLKEAGIIIDFYGM